MKNKKGFTIIELVIVLAVASILIAILAGLSVLTQGLVVSQRANTKSSAEYLDAKTNLEKFVSTYSFDVYAIEVENETVLNVYLLSDMENPEKSPIAKIVFNTETKNLEFYNTSESELTMYLSLNFETLVDLKFFANDELNLLKCSFDFEDYNDNTLLINLGGMGIGN